MKIQEKDFYHGAALTQIVEHNSFTALNKADNKYGHYIINHDIRLFIKSAKKTTEDCVWQFTFNRDELNLIQKNFPSNNSANKLFVCLVCVPNTICVLNEDQLNHIISFSPSKITQWIKVEGPENKSMRVKGSNGPLDKTIPHNAFPNILFE